MKNKITLFFLLMIFLASLLLRLFRLDALPLYSDEAGHYQIYHQIIEKTPKLTSWLYNQTYNRLFSFTWLFGLTPLGVRFGSVFYGALGAVASYLFASSVGKKKKVACLTSILMVILPWAYMVSRLGHTHVSIIVFLVPLQAYFFLKAKSFRGNLLSLLFLLLLAIYYPSMTIIAPVIATLVLLDSNKYLQPHSRKIFWTLLFLSIVLISILLANRFRLLLPGSRSFDLAIWRDINTPYDIDKYRALSWNSQPGPFSFSVPPEQLANKLFLNRITANLSVFGRSYLSFFSPDWLFLKGDAILRHSTGMVGAFYPFLLPFMLYGAFRFFKTADPKTRNLFLVWILVSPVPAALTKDGAGYLLRAATMLPFLTYFCALGLVESFNLVRKNWRWSYGLALGLIAFYSVWSFFYGYFHVYPALSARSYEYGFKELSDFQVASKGKTMLIVWDGYYHVGDFLFWQNVPFVEYEKMKITPIGIGETTFWKTLPNLYFTVPKDTKNVAQFIKDYQPAFLVLPDRYFVKYSDDLLKLTAGKVYEIQYPDKTIALTIYTLK